MPVTRAPTACSARTNSRWLRGKDGSRKTTSIGIGRSLSDARPTLRRCAKLCTVKILFISSEVAPFAKAGGLADVSAALPRRLHPQGHDVRLFVPMYARVRAPGRAFTEVIPEMSLSVGPHRIAASIHSTPLPKSSLNVHFVSCPPLYDRPSIYGEGP